MGHGATGVIARCALRSLCSLCTNPLQKSIHRYSAKNHIDLGQIPPYLHLILFDLTQMEEMLCSLTSLCFLMWVSKGGQYKTCGNVITFLQDIMQLCMALPHLPEQLDMLVVQKPAACDPSTYKDFRVHKHKVLTFLRFLKDNNLYYSNVTISPSHEVDLPLNGDVLHRLLMSPLQLLCPSPPSPLLH